ncbi:hypothetical protein DM860_007944 [Cuscuta australis]|uniref:Uncharacterized protein n=1 Tax=Cuscuta australis TaxID=267555 RepID=A0A328DYH4_9ASTE|nr:hypothetical protein DM860_007944 [Cuscuta australis]
MMTYLYLYIYNGKGENEQCFRPKYWAGSLPNGPITSLRHRPLESPRKFNNYKGSKFTLYASGKSLHRKLPKFSTKLTRSRAAFLFDREKLTPDLGLLSSSTGVPCKVLLDLGCVPVHIARAPFKRPSIGFKVLAFCLDIHIHFGGGEGKTTRATGLLAEQGGRR